MGSGIAHVSGQSGFEVLLFDLEDRLLERALSGISRNMERQVARGALDAGQKVQALERIETTRDLSTFETVDFVVEAVTENLDVKSRIFGDLDRIASPETILASNTSSISITSLGAATGRAERVIGMHFMNPVPMMELVEVISGRDTSPGTLDRTVGLARRMGKTPVQVNDSPGFVSNRVLIPMINEAAFCLMEGVATAEAVDSIMKLGMSHPLGPLALADLIGLDVCVNIMEVLHRELGDSKYRPCPLLVDMVESGHLGRKSGQGFYSYPRQPTS